MKIRENDLEKNVLRELGSRVQSTRIDLNLSQVQLAKKCGISVSTLVRIENGEDTKLSNIIKLMQGMGILENLNVLIPERQPYYKDIFYGKPARKRVRAVKKASRSKWTWGEDL